MFDQYLHFEHGVDPATGQSCYGCGMTVLQMIQALHANIYGLQYNYWGSLDVTGPSLTNFSTGVGSDNPGVSEENCYLDLAYNCIPSFDNWAVLSDKVLSEPLIWKPNFCRSSAMPLIPMPPIPIK